MLSIVENSKQGWWLYGHLTEEPTETVYPGVVSLRNLRLAMFLAELNNLQLWGADGGQTYKKSCIL